MHKGGIADDSDRLSFAFAAADLIEAVQRADGSAHAEGHFNGAQRRDGTQGITADIAQDSALVLLQCIEEAPVGTAGAHDGRTGRNGVLDGIGAFLLLPEGFRDQVLGEFVDQRQDLLAGDRDAQSADMVLDDGVQFFHDIQFVHFGREIPDQVHRKRIGHTQLQDADSITKDFFNILIGGGGGNDTDLRAAHLDPVQG